MVTAVDTSLRAAGRIYLNFYGPPLTIHTVRFADLITDVEPFRFRELEDFRDQVVFIGAGDVSAVDQTDGFPSVFTTRGGLDIAGVEIAATAFANLLEGRQIVPLSPGTHLLWVVVVGSLVGAIGMLLPGVWGPMGMALVAFGYAVAARWQFEVHALWWPLFTPLVVQLPAAMVLTQFVKYLRSRAESDRYREYTVRYLPKFAKPYLDQGAEPDRVGTEIHGVCMITDITGYTTTTQDLAPRKLAKLQNEYFTLLEAEVQANDGDVLRVEGDSMAAVWTDGDDERALRLNACLAALAIRRRVEDFNARHPDTMLPTRIGLMVGPMVIGNVGGAGRYTYTATGTVISVAARIESANKVLGTSILCGEPVISGLDGLVVRRLGRFALKGRTRPEAIYELIGSDPDAPARDEHDTRFSEALEHFECGRWAAARRLFATLDREREDDGPSRFYADLCARYMDSPPEKGKQHAARLDAG